MKLRVVVSLAALLLGCSDNGATTNDTGTTDANQTDATESDGQAKRCKGDFPFAFDDLCFAEPAVDSKRTQCGEIVENCDTSGEDQPQLQCWEQNPAKPDGPSTVTLAGFIDVFSSGPDADQLVVEVYDFETLQAAVIKAANEGTLTSKSFPTVTPLGTDTVKLDWEDTTKPPSDPTRGAARACPADKKSGLPCVVPSPNCGDTQPYCDLAGDEYCHEDHCEERLRWETRYRVENVPTNKRLVIRTHGPGTFDDGTWGVMALFSVYLRADAPPCEAGQYEHCINDGEYEYEVNAISLADYSTIPVTAGLSAGIPPGKGAISGEVRDCDNIKLSNFHVTTDPQPTVMVYFNGNPISTLPELGRFTSGTNVDALFAALDIEPGVVQVGTVGQVGGQKVSAGKITAAVLPDTVTVVSFDGPDPR